LKLEELKKAAETMRELTDDWKENIAIAKDAAVDRKTLDAVKLLSKQKNQGNLIKIGLMLIAFPFPIVVDDALGYPLLAAGLLQRRIKNSALYLEDFSKTLPDVVKELQELGRAMK
jgi:hypothetical protein